VDTRLPVRPRLSSIRGNLVGIAFNSGNLVGIAFNSNARVGGAVSSLVAPGTPPKAVSPGPLVAPGTAPKAVV